MSEYKRLCTCANQSELAFLKSILNSEEIAYYVVGYDIPVPYKGDIYPEIFVHQNHFEKARELLQRFKAPNNKG